MKKIISKLHTVIHEMTRFNRTPEEMAKAFAIGVGIGVSPFVGLHTYMALAVSSLRRLPVYPLIVGSHMVNIVTLPFVYTCTTKLGMWILGIDVSIDFDWGTLSLNNLMHLGKQLLLPFFLGSLLAAFPAGILSYFISLKFFKYYRLRHPIHE